MHKIEHDCGLEKHLMIEYLSKEFITPIERQDALEVAYLIQKCCNELRKALVEFPNFRKSKTLHQYIVEVNRLEEEGDNIYVEATRRLYISDMDPVNVMAWTHVFHILEKACDACEDVTDVIEGVMMKNP